MSPAAFAATSFVRIYFCIGQRLSRAPHVLAPIASCGASGAIEAPSSAVTKTLAMRPRPIAPTSFSPRAPPDFASVSPHEQRTKRIDARTAEAIRFHRAACHAHFEARFRGDAVSSNKRDWMQAAQRA